MLLKLLWHWIIIVELVIVGEVLSFFPLPGSFSMLYLAVLREFLLIYSHDFYMLFRHSVHFFFMWIALTFS